MATATTGGWNVLKQQARVSAVPSPDPSIDTADSDAELAEKQRVEDLLLEARERFRDAVNASDKQRREMLEDLKFYCGMQQDPVIPVHFLPAHSGVQRVPTRPHIGGARSTDRQSGTTGVRQ